MTMNVTDVFRGTLVDPQHGPERVKRDVSDLPPHAVERLEIKLPELVALAEAEVGGLTPQHEEHRARLADIDRAIGGYSRDGDTEQSRKAIADLEKQKEREKRNQRKVMEAGAAKSRRHHAFREVLLACEKRAILLLGGTAPIEALIPEVQKEPDERWADLKRRVQGEREAKEDKRFGIEGAMVPPEQGLRMALSSIRRQAQGPIVSAKPSGDGFSIEWPRQRVLAEPLTAGGIPFANDAVALIGALFPDRLEEEVTKQITAFYESYGGPILAAPEKRRALAKIDKELLRLERIEAEMIWQGIEAGEDLHFRPDTDPRAVLGIA